MDHDNFSLPERFAKQVAFLESHPEVGVVGTGYKRIPAQQVQKHYVLHSQIEKDLMFGCSILHPSAMIRASVLKENNLRYEAEFSPAEDYALWCRMLGKTTFANLPDILLLYRDHSDNTSHKQAKKLREGGKKVQNFVHQAHPQLYAMACQSIDFPSKYLPLFSYQIRGQRRQLKILGCRIKLPEKIFFKECSNLPIYIINFNRLSYLKEQIKSFEKLGLRNIHIIDNASTYPPMLQYLKTTPYQVHYMKQNYGHMVFFKAKEFQNVRENEYFVLTDNDLVPIEECPRGFLEYFYQLLQKYPKIEKVGFSLKTDDLPEHYQMRDLVIKWESLFTKKPLTRLKPILYRAPIDTTFALYRPLKDCKPDSFFKALRVGYPYQLRHLPWYKDLSKLTEEDIFYNNLDCGSGNWNNAASALKIKEAMITKKLFSWTDYIFSIKKRSMPKPIIVIRILGIKMTLNQKKLV